VLISEYKEVILNRPQHSKSNEVLFIKSYIFNLKSPQYYNAMRIDKC